MAGDELDLGDGHFLRYTAWAPDRDLNPQYAELPDVDRVGAIIRHPRKDTGAEHQGSVMFDSEVVRRVFSGPAWQVQSWEPLTISPSILCDCGDHGFIQAGRWVPA